MVPCPTTNRGESGPAAHTRSEVDAFLADLKKKASSTRGRLIFALDATQSREQTWDTACHLQADMFREAASAGGLDLQLVYYRGLDECKASSWISDPTRLGKIMSTIMCRAGRTQIERVLDHAVKETRMLPVSALVFVGDAFEEDEDTIIIAVDPAGDAPFWMTRSNGAAGGNGPAIHRPRERVWQLPAMAGG